jgi:hypothetical protein
MQLKLEQRKDAGRRNLGADQAQVQEIDAYPAQSQKDLLHALLANPQSSIHSFVRPKLNVGFNDK